MRILRLARITTVALRFGLDDLLLSHERLRGLRPWVHRALFWRDLSQPRARAPAARARGAGTDLRQVRADAVDAARPAAAGHRRRTREAAGPRAAVPGRAGDRDAGAQLPQAGGRGLRVVRPHADRERIGGAGALRRTAGRHAGGGQGAASGHRRGDRARPRADAHRGRDSSSACPPTAAACARARSSASSRRRSATSST